MRANLIDYYVILIDYLHVIYVVIHYTSMSSPHQPPNHNIYSHHLSWPIKTPLSFFIRKPKPNSKNHSNTTSQNLLPFEPKPPLLSNPLPSLQKWLVTHQELRKGKNLQRESKVNAPKHPSIAWTLGSMMKERKVITS